MIALTHIRRVEISVGQLVPVFRRLILGNPSDAGVGLGVCRLHFLVCLFVAREVIRFICNLKTVCPSVLRLLTHVVVSLIEVVRCGDVVCDLVRCSLSCKALVCWDGLVTAA